MENETNTGYTGYNQTSIPQEQQPVYGQQHGDGQQQQYNQPYMQQHAEDRPLTALDMLGQEFAGTKAASFRSIEDLAKSYNNLVSLMGGRIENLPPQQRAELIKALGVNNTSIPRAVSDYKIKSELYPDKPKYVETLQVAASEMRLTQEQANEMTELLESFGETVKENVINSIQQTIQNKAVGYMEASKKVFGNEYNDVVQTADYVIEKIVPHVCGMSEKAFCTLLADHGLIGHPAILALLTHIGDLYAQGRGSIAGNVPVGAYAGGNGNDLSFYRTPAAQKILGNVHHPLYKEYVKGLTDAAFKARKMK